jgi:two-component system sensor histidine kinase CpxA
LAGQKRFLGDVAHELCSPLARLRTGLGILEQRLADAERPRLESIEGEAAELAVLIEEILVFSRAAAGRTLQRKPVPLASLVARVAARECPDLTLALDLDPGLAAAADERLLERAVANLLRNARRYAGPAAGIRVGAETRRGLRVALWIDDDGPGVAEAELERLFEPFYRPDSARSREHGGSGLGLAIVRSCAEACGGSASARNLAPRGFRVELLLPAAEVPA